MAKLTILLILVAICVAFIGYLQSFANDSGTDFNLDELFLTTLNICVNVTGATAVVFFVQWLAQIKLSAQILLNFFFFAWQNSQPYEIDCRYRSLFPSLET